jgi:hypothetical protein
MAQGTVKWFKNEKGVERTTDSEAHRGLAPMCPKAIFVRWELKPRKHGLLLPFLGTPLIRAVPTWHGESLEHIDSKRNR